MIGFEIVMKINARSRTEFLQAFEMIRNEEAHRSSCIDIGLFEEVNSANTFLWIERWRDDDALVHYLESSTYRMMLGAVNVLGKLVERRMCRFEEELAHDI